MRSNQESRISTTLKDTEKLRSKTLLTPLTRRILAVTLVAPVLLGLGLLFLDEYEESLISTEIDALRTEGELIAAAIGEGAVVIESESDAFTTFMPAGANRRIDSPTARQLIRRLAELANIRARLYDRGGVLVADSSLLQGPGGEVRLIDLPPHQNGQVSEILRRALAWVEDLLGLSVRLEPYIEQKNGTAYDFVEVVGALEQGEPGNSVRLDPDGHKILNVAVPVQFYKEVVGAVLVSDGDANLERRLFEVRSAILNIFAWTCIVTFLLSLYLASTIARPVRRLADAAMLVRGSSNRSHDIPDLSNRGDEIGALSTALRDMTRSLWLRMDATEQFAADVAHEIKNPLTSLRSAVETIARVQDPNQQKQLMSIIGDDVTRLDRLISDISDASRLDAELSRAETESVDISTLLRTLAQITNANDKPDAVKVSVDIPVGDNLLVNGIEGRLAQVFRNLISNAESFSPRGGKIFVRAGRQSGTVWISVADQGPGISKGKEKEIFSRFYSERPAREKFGTHSGLGLSISKHIVEAHQGTITAENTKEGNACFIVHLPALKA